ncbi:SpoIIE family protein phosphatase [Ruficoccus sp. ZRK36]|uniref:SpoIIE family protein phosphatase n=1 Tax=Ruficoccus sp. ZRK36 TaxID=2866311 RepID=UPI001C72B67B|nr:SpoIIE family protein phosphatase [Ruficoccus sp. ZRK36]QYY36982.1 SpoIIE family protein phosphatase [Ruficoccus sp. ZRK36]
MADEPVKGDFRVLSARVELVETLREDFGLFLRDLGVDDKSLAFWQLILSEAVVNAIVHGCKSDSQLNVEVKWMSHGREVLLEIKDPGSGPPEKVIRNPELPEDPFQAHGRGVFLIENFADRLEHWKSSHGYCLRIFKNHEEIQGDEIDTVLEQALNELSVCYESLAAFYRLGDGLVRAESVSHFISQAIDDLKKVVGDARMTLYYSDSLQDALHEEISAQPFAHMWSRLEGRLAEVVESRDELVWEEPDEVEDDPILSAYACGICCPIQAGGKLYGVFCVVREQLPYFNAGEMNNVRTFSDLFGIALANADNTIVRSREQRAFQELEIAAEIQKTLLPLPTIECPPQWQIFATRRSARDVAGDYLEVQRSQNGDTYLAVVDVMGKGVSAAFLAAMFRTAFNIILHMDYTLLGLAQTLNRILCQQVGDMTLFATCAIARIPASLDRIELVNAGHCPVLLEDKAGNMRECHPSGPPFGLFSDALYQCDTFEISAGDRLMMITDGLYEWETQEDVWGWDAFLEFVREEAKSSPFEFWDKLQAKMQRECPDIEATRDDQTLLIWEYSPPENPLT